MLVASVNTMLTPVSTSAHKNGVRVGENTENNQTIASSRRSNLTDTGCFHVKNIKFECLNLPLKHEKGKIFRKIRIFYSSDIFIVTFVTDRKCSAADNVVLAILRS